jgi:riboflavin synthase
MFTGLVEAVGAVVGSVRADAGVRLEIAAPFAGELARGDSIAVNGVCLTVVLSDASVFRADVGPETIRVTTLGRLDTGAAVNLERPVRADGRLGGHFVLGHVDGRGRIDQIRPAADFQWITVGYPRELAPYLVSKGSVAVDGISLTVARLGNGGFDVQVIPYTLEHTNLSRARVGDEVNIECDLVGKYVVRGLDVVRSRV